MDARQRDRDEKLDLIVTASDYGRSEVLVYYGSGPRLKPQAPSVDFGDVALGTASAPITGTITNEGPGAAGPLQLIVDGDTTDFVLDRDECSGAALAIGQGCAMQLRFRPTIAGDRLLYAAVVAPDSDEAYWVALSGSGVAASATPTPTPTPTAPAPTTTAPGPRTLPAGRLSRVRTARLTGHGKRLRVDTGWRVACPADNARCRIQVLLVARARPGRRAPVLARASLAVPAGEAHRPIVGLTSTGRRLLRPGRAVKAVLSVTLTRAGSSPVIRESRVTLRAPATP